jgi:hypothetical protein
MANAWGKSWGKSWGNSWGAVTVQVEDENGVGWYYRERINEFNTNRLKREEEEILLILKIFTKVCL